MPSISIIIVSYNTCDLLARCLNSVLIAKKKIEADVEIWVVDNVSTDGTVEMVSRDFPETHLIVNDQNIGFSCANNVVLKQIKSDICILLNPDTELDEHTLIVIQQAFSLHPEIGIVGPLLLNTDGSLQPSFGDFPSIVTEFMFQTFLFKVLPTPFPFGEKVNFLQEKSYRYAHQVGWVSGACLAIRRNVVEKVGLLDEKIFMYGEDMEWCWRARQAGFPIWFWPDAKVIHHVRQSSRQNYSTWIARYTTGNLYFFSRYRTKRSLVIVSVLVCGGSLLRILIWSVIGFVFKRIREQAWQRVSGYNVALALGLKSITGRDYSF